MKIWINLSSGQNLRRRRRLHEHVKRDKTRSDLKQCAKANRRIASLKDRLHKLELNNHDGHNSDQIEQLKAELGI